MKKKLLIYAHYFYPDVASTAQILLDLSLGLVDDFDITVVCAVPSYTGKIEAKYKNSKFYFEEYKGLKIVRVRVLEYDKKNKLSRIKNIITYYRNAIKITKKLGKFDIVYSISQPPILGGMLGVKGKKITKAKYVYNIQDFNPEQVLAVNYSKNKLITNLMMKLDKRSCRKADLIITVGRDMKETLSKRFNNKNVPNNTVINNWINEKEVYPLDKDDKLVMEFKNKYNLNNKFIIMYSGNVGLYYDLENIIKVFKKYKDNSDVLFAIIGEGAVKQKLIDYCKCNDMNNVRFIPYQDKQDLIYSLNSADIHLVTNAKGIKGVSVPSKIYDCLATNVPILGILEEGTEAWKIIEESNCGILAKAGNYEEIEKCLDKIIEEKDIFINKHQSGRSYLINNFTKDKSIDKYKKELKKL